jgi:hypothetical protein
MVYYRTVLSACPVSLEYDNIRFNITELGKEATHF